MIIKKRGKSREKLKEREPEWGRGERVQTNGEEMQTAGEEKVFQSVSHEGHCLHTDHLTTEDTWEL